MECSSSGADEQRSADAGAAACGSASDDGVDKAYTPGTRGKGACGAAAGCGRVACVFCVNACLPCVLCVWLVSGGHGRRLLGMGRNF